MNVSDTVHAELRRRLITGHYEPGSQLKEEHVAADLGVSRTPVRTAIQKLIAEGLLEPALKRGAIVTQWHERDVEDVFALRILLEGHAAALATRDIDDDTVNRMEELNNAIARAVKEKRPGFLDIVQQLNLSFHMLLYEASGSSHLRMFGSSLLDYPMIIGGFFIYSDADMAESIRQHTEIVSALRVRNADWARAAVTCHLSAAVERFRRKRYRDDVRMEVSESWLGKSEQRG